MAKFCCAIRPPCHANETPPDEALSCLDTDNDFHFDLGFKFSTQTMVFTLNLDSRKGSLHEKWF